VPAKEGTLQRLLLGLGTVPLIAGCVQGIPTDPQGTLNEVRSGTINVGVTPNEDFVKVADGQPQGNDVTVVRGFADSLGADVKWTVAGEEQLVTELEAGRLDLVAGGISSKTPWSEKVGMTRPYTTHVNGDGKEIKIVMLTPPGENAFLFELESYLDKT